MPGSENRKRQHLVQIRVTEEEKKIVKQDAVRAGVATGYYVRNLLLNAPIPRKSKRPPIETELLRKTLAELNKIGSNINQLARAHNQGKSPCREDVVRELEALNQLTTQVLISLDKSSLLRKRRRSVDKRKEGGVGC